MMKLNNIRISIKSKIWLSIVGTVISCIAVLWFLQVVYLEDYYLQGKEREFKDISQKITASISEKGYLGSQDDLYALAVENTLCIDVCDGYGNSVVKYESFGYNCYIHQNMGRRMEYLQFAIESNGEVKTITAYSSSNGGPAYLVSPVTGQMSDGTPFIVTTVIALAPVQEAVLAIRGQFVIIAVILIIMAAGAAIWITSSLTKNIMKITNAARQVAHGNLEVDVVVDTNDELGDLSLSFSEMTKEISKVNVLQKELVANISHDIRTPLTMIKGYAETIRDLTGNNPELRERQLDIIVEETNRLNTLVSDVMDLSLLQAGQSPLNKSVFDIAERVRTILSRFQLLEQTSDFIFTQEGEQTAIVCADPVRIEQVLYNLINNAVNHIGVEKHITVSIMRDTNDSSLYIVSVADTGTGISQEDLPLIWDRYYKPYKKTERKGMGTGLGLSIVKAILVNHNARFGVTSTLGVGSRFWFTLQSAENVLRLE